MNLSSFSTCDISDGLLKLGYTNGGFLPDIHPRTRNHAPTIGRAWTIQFVEKSSSIAPSFEGHFIDSIPRANDLPIIPIIGAPVLTNAVFGGIMAQRAKKLGCHSIIVSGRIRDVSEMNDLEMSVYSTGTSTVGAGGSSKAVSVGSSCEILNYGTVHTDEIVVIDENGIVVIPRSLDVNALVDMMTTLTKQDDLVKHAIDQGSSVFDAFRKYR